MEEEQNKFHRSFIFKFVNTIVGTGNEYRITLLVSLLLGFIYSFEVWDQPAILIVFGMILPAMYITGLYRFLYHQKKEAFKNKFTRLASSQTGNWSFIIIDILLTFGAGFLILEGILDYGIVKFLLTVLLPLLYITTLYLMVKQEKEPEEGKESGEE